MKKVYLITLLVMLSVVSGAHALDLTKSFIKANEAYEKGDFAESTEIYEAILMEVKNGSLYYNLGNSYFKQGKIGLALVNYLRAERYLPSNSDIRDNISYIRSLTKDKIEDKSLSNYIYKAVSFYDVYNLKRFFYIFVTLNAVFFFVLTIRLYYKNALLKWLRDIVLFLLVLSAIGVALNYKYYFYDDKGVIMKSEVSIRSGCSINDTVLFNLHEGAEFKVIGENGDWFKIELTDKKKGWILKKIAELV